MALSCTWRGSANQIMKIYETSKSLRDSKSQQNRTTNKENKQNRMNITGYQPKFFIDNLPKTTT